MTSFDELINIQKQYREGKLKEEEIPKEKLKELKMLYHMQIELLEQSIEEDKKKILELRKHI